MGYIRSNEEWYENQGMSPKQARKQCRIDKLMEGKEPGYCNPRKADEYAKELAEAERKAEAQEA